MYCYKCGKNLVEEANFCPICGTKVVKDYKGESKKTVTISPAVSKFECFDRNQEEIKNRDQLTFEQIKYIQKPSITILGPLNFLIRRHWDLFVMVIILNIVGKISEYYKSLAGDLLVLGSWGIILYFGIKHGRRLAWNRSKWKSFDEFKISEKKWMPWSILMIVLLGLILLGYFMIGFMEGSR